MIDDRAKYCCFLHPLGDFSLKGLDDPCPECGRPYGFPLSSAPSTVMDYTVVAPIARGFYGATYEATWGRLGRRFVLKIVPMAVYRYFGKDFEHECTSHSEVAEGTDHLNDIVNFFNIEVQFGDVTLDCHVAVLEYVEGVTLDRILAEETVSARRLAQLAIDLFRLLQELEQKGKYHNDLHERNLIVQTLGPDRRRLEVVDEEVRLVAVDLGSIDDESKSGPGRPALGDLAAVAQHLLGFARTLLDQPDDIPDVDYRLACTLDELAHALGGAAANIRTPDYLDFIDQIRESHAQVSSPWRPPRALRRLNDSYNAQTLHPWFVPRLLVDPRGDWVAAISTKGPQVITGMRGCGKTMLLRALQFHSRLIKHQDRVRTEGGDLAELVHDDGYVGLYVSCTRLLDGLGSPTTELHEPYARLLVAYAREGLRAIRHLREELPDHVRAAWWRDIGEVVSEALGSPDELTGITSDAVLERRLQRILFSLDRGEERFALRTNPGVIFPALAEAIVAASSLWDGATVFFLLDDVSTRHLNEDSIASMLGTLLFGSERCAFKMTTEAQTLELALRSPGLIERARAGRDYEPFDLAAAVNEQLKDPHEGRKFIAQILQLRAEQFENHPRASPQELLGDEPLESIARKIVATGKSGKEKKSIYTGLSALTAICVGDIGDVLNIYESMLRKVSVSASAIPARLQNEAFQEYCSRRLYHLNRRKGELKDFALSFAEAARELLFRSAVTMQEGDRKRLRQYAQLYVRITTGDVDAQFEKLRELIDAGVFVLEGGSDAPRTKTRDSDPIAQFNLTFRKLFGLSQYMGLAFSDRFELSGEDLAAWLSDPANGKQILMRNLGGPLTDEEEAAAQRIAAEAIRVPDDRAQATLQLELDVVPSGDSRVAASEAAPGPDVVELRRTPVAIGLTGEQLANVGVDVVLLGLGFEERTPASAARVFELVQPNTVLLVRYAELGHAGEIEAMARELCKDVQVLDYDDVRTEGLRLPPGLACVDVTGLAKPLIFSSVRSSLRDTGRVVVAHTRAERHYPLDDDIGPILAQVQGDDPFATLEAAGLIWSGERTPYAFDRLLASDADDSRRRLLCAAASPKHERLLSLLDERVFDRVEIIAPLADRPRGALARLAADVATRGLEDAHVATLETDDLDGMLTFLSHRFHEFYVGGGFDVELGLTGSKMHAVACAAISSAFKIAQCWYVRPAGFDPDRFTHGVADTRWYDIRRPDLIA